MKQSISKFRRHVGHILLLALGLSPLAVAPRLAETYNWQTTPWWALTLVLLLSLVATGCLVVLCMSLLGVSKQPVPAADPHTWWLGWLRVNLDLLHKRLFTDTWAVPIADEQPTHAVLTMADSICCDLLKHYWHSGERTELLSLPTPWLDIQRPGDPAKPRLSHVVVSRTRTLRLGGYPTTDNGSPLPNVQQGQIRRFDLNEFDTQTQLTVLRLVVAELHKQWK